MSRTTTPTWLTRAAPRSGAGAAIARSVLNGVTTAIFHVGKGRVQAIAELYNVTNDRPSQANLTTYGGSWLRPTSILGGRLFKFGAQVDW